MTQPAREHRSVGTKGVPRQEREVQILDAAAEEFANRGYAFASVADIAANAGISKPLVYTYFGSKDGLFLAVLRRAGEGLVTAVAEAQRDTGPVRALHTLEAVFGTLEPRRHDWRVLYDDTLPAESVVHLEARGYRRQLAHLGVAGTHEVLAGSGVTDELDSSLLAAIWLGAVTSVVGWWLDHPEESAEAMTTRSRRVIETLRQL
jgi:AcrR family transcriptional regulator